ncbi:MAG: tRNA (adenosine(37)-N6)-dimethylallyltransferase MiaA [Calditrichaceae bacterium]
MPVVPIIVGPTAIGKTYLSLLLAERISAEVISADSRQIFKYMDIGTAKVDKESQKKVPHHMIDICNPDEYFSAGMYSKLARKIIDHILSEGKLPIVVGGSGFYISALIDGIFDTQIHDPDIRWQLQQRVENEGLEALYKELEQYDPEYAAKININDKQRILRSLEVYLSTGQPFSKWHKQKTNPANFQYKMIGLNMDRKLIYKRIDERVDKMIDQGLVNEVKHLQKLGYNAKLTALKTVGYREVFACLNDSIDFDTMVKQIKQNTRRYAKRQLTWFRRDKRIKWFEALDREELMRIALQFVNNNYN